MTSLPVAVALSRPVALAETRLMEVPAMLADLFPERGLRRGSTVAIDATVGGTSLALALVAAVSAQDGWTAAVGLGSLGLVAAAEMEVRLDRLALVPDPGAQWPAVVAALIDGFDLLLLRPAGRVRPADARRLTARVRERGAVMMVMGGSWPESPDLRLTAASSGWTGLGHGYGHLRTRRLDVVLRGRRAASQERRQTVWLPGPGPELPVTYREVDRWDVSEREDESRSVAPAAAG